MGTELFFVFCLIVVGGIFAMAEIALVSVRKSRLEQLSQEGNTRAVIALEIANDPQRFLSAIQFGITLLGVFASAVGGATLSDDFNKLIQPLPYIGPYGEIISFVIVVIGITYVTLVIGELVPKSLALTYGEQITLTVAAPMRLFMKVTYPFIHVLSGSTNSVLRLFGVKEAQEQEITQDEIEIMIEQGTESGALDETEQEMVTGVFRLGDRLVSLLMTQRKDIVWLNINDPLDVTLATIADSNHSHFPVAEDSLDTILGMVSIKDIFRALKDTKSVNLKALLTPPLYVPDNLPALRILSQFKEHGTHLALVLDEYGSFEGIVTLNDFMETIVGELSSDDDGDEPAVVTRPDGSWLIDGGLANDELKELLHVQSLYDEERGEYHTLAGMILSLLGRIPSIGDSVTWEEFTFEIVDMDGNRIDRVLVAKVAD
jgi:putative hemolysin